MAKPKRQPQRLNIGPKTRTRISTFNVRSNLNDQRLSMLAGAAHVTRSSIIGLTETKKIGVGEKVIHPPFDAAKSCFLYWSGHKDDKQKCTGVALVLTREAKDSMQSIEFISDRLLKARFVTRHLRLTLFVAYAPRSSHNATVQDAFWSQLSEEISRAPRHDMTMVIGDLNASTGQDRHGIDSVLGPWTNSAARNRPGESLIDMCLLNNMVITNTFFQHKEIHRNTFQGSQVNSKPKMIDYVLVNRRFRTSVLDTRVYRAASGFIDSDHELVISTVRLKFRARRRPPARPRLNTESLANDTLVRSNYRAAVKKHLDAEQQRKGSAPVDPRERIEQKWSKFKHAIEKASAETVPKVELKTRVPWLTEEVFDIIGIKANKFYKWRDARNNGCSKAVVSELRAAYTRARNEANAACSRSRMTIWNEEAKTNSEDIKAGRFGTVFSRLRKFARAKKKASSGQLRSKEGVLLTTTRDKLNRWREYFGTLLHTENPEEDCKEDLHHAPPGRPLYIQPPDDPAPSLADIEAALTRLKNRRAAGPDGIVPEFLKHGGPTLRRALHELIKDVWESESAPQEWKDALIVTLYKKKDPTLCDNHRGLSLLSVPGKLYALLLLNPLQDRLEELVMESQCGFRKGRSTTDQLFTLQQVFQDSWEYDVPVHACFIDLRKAYDTVNRPALWGVLQHVGISGKLQRLIRDLHTGTRSSILLT